MYLQIVANSKSCQIFFLIWHIGSQTKYHHTSGNSCKLNPLFWSFQIKTLFVLNFWVSAPLNSCSKVVRLAMYVGIFQFNCTWKFKNCRIFRSNHQFVYKNSEVGCSCVIGWKNCTWPCVSLTSESFQFCFEMVYCKRGTKVQDCIYCIVLEKKCMVHCHWMVKY